MKISAHELGDKVHRGSARKSACVRQQNSVTDFQSSPRTLADPIGSLANRRTQAACFYGFCVLADPIGSAKVRDRIFLAAFRGPAVNFVCRFMCQNFGKN